MFTAPRGLLAPQNTFLDTVIRRCDGPNSCFILLNARILEYPIVFASSAFTELVGYSRIEVLQKPGICSFLHGPKTSKDILETIENAYKEQNFEQVEVIFYRKNLTARWIMVRVAPIRNEQDSVVLFLVTFRDISAYRQPLEDDFAANSALGAFAAASDAGSSWGRFARLVFSMVRQRNEEEEGEGENDQNPQDDSNVPENQSELMKPASSTDAAQCAMQGKCAPGSVKDTNNGKGDKTPKTNAGKHEVRMKLGNKSPSTNSSSRVTSLEEGLYDPKHPEKNGHSKKFGLVWRLRRPGRKIISSLSSDAVSLNSLGKRRYGGPNADAEEHFGHGFSPETLPRYRLEPPCPPKHVLLHYSAFRQVWDWTILLLTLYTAVVVPLRLAVIPRPTWAFTKEQTVRLLDTHRSNLPDILAITDAVIDVIFCLDIVLNFHTSFVGAGGEVVAEPPVIRINYLSGWFTLDLISCLPYELIKYLWPTESQDIYTLLDGLRIIRLLRIGRALRRMDQYLEYVSTLLLLLIVCFFMLAHWFACAWYAVGVLDLENKIQYGWIPRYFNDSLKPQNWDAFVTVNQPAENYTPMSDYLRIDFTDSFKTIWPTNQFYPNSGQLHPSELIQMEPDQQPQTSKQTANSEHRVPLQNAVDKWSAYLTSLYFTLSLLTTIGFGNVAAYTEAEKLLSVCCMLVGGGFVLVMRCTQTGKMFVTPQLPTTAAETLPHSVDHMKALVYATIFGNITTIVQQMYSTRTRYNEIMKGVKDFLRIHEVPQELGERVIDYITSSWTVNRGIDTAKVLNYCPKDMQADISVHLNRCVFNTHSAFRLASDGCRRSLAVNFQTLHTAPGDLIFHQGEGVDQLCFIASGSLEVIQDDEIIAILGKGDVFGDPQWKNLNSVPSAASVRALTYCTLHTIRLERLRSVLQFYHAFSNSFTRNLELTHNLCNRVIFRKLADVKREMELSMRRNQQPLTSNLPSGHPVRKLISRMQRPSQSGDFSVRQGLSTIMSGDSSVEGSEKDNSSISGSVTNDTASKKLASIASNRSFGRGGEFSTQPNSRTSSPGIPSPLHEPKSSGCPSETLPPEVLAASNCSSLTSRLIARMAQSQSLPARRWARLIYKATQPRLQNVKEETTEETSKASDNVLPSTATAPQPSAPSSIKEAAPPATQLNLSEHENMQKDTFKQDDIKSILIRLEGTVNSANEEFRQQLSEIITRIQSLEDQVGDINRKVSTPNEDHVTAFKPVKRNMSYTTRTPVTITKNP